MIHPPDLLAASGELFDDGIGNVALEHDVAEDTREASETPEMEEGLTRTFGPVAETEINSEE